MEKQKLLYQQARLHNRGAAEMVLQMISACKGDGGPEPAGSGAGGRSGTRWSEPSSPVAWCPPPQG